VIEFAGIQFKNPFVVASSLLTVKPELLRRADEYGAAAVSVELCPMDAIAMQLV
jgi:dihydroorotate dehydrogenase